MDHFLICSQCSWLHHAPAGIEDDAIVSKEADMRVKLASLSGLPPFSREVSYLSCIVGLGHRRPPTMSLRAGKIMLGGWLFIGLSGTVDTNRRRARLRCFSRSDRRTRAPIGVTIPHN